MDTREEKVAVRSYSSDSQMPSETAIAYMRLSRDQLSFKMVGVPVLLHLMVVLKSSYYKRLYQMRDYIHTMFDISKLMALVPSWAIQ